jgi:hypothetical protein
MVNGVANSVSAPGERCALLDDTQSAGLLGGGKISEPDVSRQNAHLHPQSPH